MPDRQYTLLIPGGLVAANPQFPGFLWGNTTGTNPSLVMFQAAGSIYQGIGTVYGLAFDANYIYATDQTNQKIWRIPRLGGQGIPIATALISIPAGFSAEGGIMVDSKYLYLVTGNTGSPNFLSAVAQFDKTTGALISPTFITYNHNNTFFSDIILTPDNSKFLISSGVTGANPVIVSAPYPNGGPASVFCGSGGGSYPTGGAAYMCTDGTYLYWSSGGNPHSPNQKQIGRANGNTGAGANSAWATGNDTAGYDGVCTDGVNLFAAAQAGNQLVYWPIANPVGNPTILYPSVQMSFPGPLKLIT